MALAGVLLILGCVPATEAPVSSPDLALASVEPPPWRYAVVIDASSSSTWLQIFQWRPDEEGRLPRIVAAPYPRAGGDEVWDKKIKPPLAEYAGRPEEAARSLEPLIDFALERLGDDPAVLSQTALYLRATAGMRLLTAEQQEEILGGVRRYFATLPFGETSARVISGQEEGVFGWLTANYIVGHLEHGGPFPTLGALDLGGASTQITFQPLDYPREDELVIDLGRNSFHLYTHSYLGLGQDQARQRVASPACYLAGFPLPDGSTGTGDWAACRQAIRETFAQPCAEEPCSLFGVYQPPTFGQFLGLSVYAYTADFFDLGQRLSPAKLAAAGAEFCSTDWQELIGRDPGAAENPYLPNYCFSAAWIVTLLTDGFGFPDDSDQITPALRVQGTVVGWTLGALLYELAAEPDAE